MKKLIFTLTLVLAYTIQMFGQRAQKPSLMVMPDNEWCIAKGYVNNGAPDFAKALQDSEFQACVIQFSGLLAERGYKPKDLSNTLENFKNGKAKRLVATGKDGSQVVESDEDMLARAAALDIKIRFNIKTVSALGRNAVEFSVKAIDAATNDIIWAEPLPRQVTTAPANTVLYAAIAGKMDSFCQGFQAYFDEMYDEGRKCTIEFNITDSSPVNMNTEVNFRGRDVELKTLIAQWLSHQAVRGACAPLSDSDGFAEYEVKIPLVAEVDDLFGDGKTLQSVNASQWVDPLKKVLASVGLDMKTSMFGQSKVYCYISGK